MKTISRIFIFLALTTIATTSCEKIKDANTVTFEPTFTADLDCTVPVTGKAPLSPTFSASETIDPQGDPDVKKYLDKIKGYEVTSLTGTITSISASNATLVTGSIVISNTQTTAEWGVQNVPLIVGQKITLGNTTGEWDKVSQILKNGQVFTVLASGETNKGGVLFTIAIEINTIATAKAI